MQSKPGEDAAVGSANEMPQQPAPQGGAGSGEGAASAFARMKSQHDHRARQRPADDPGHGTRGDEKR